ncbi:hypothetical protein Blut17040_27240 [Blautia luti]|nr:hypothetical protein Blut17040_27240 [Blautia luti]
MLYIISLSQIIWKISKRILTTTSTTISKTKKSNYRFCHKQTAEYPQKMSNYENERIAPAYTGAIFAKAIQEVI